MILLSLLLACATLRAPATAQSPRIITLAHDLTLDPGLARLEEAVLALLHAFAQPPLPDRAMFDLMDEVSFQLANPVVHDLLGAYAVSLEEDLEELDALYEALGLTPTTTMKAVELQWTWQAATHTSL